MAAVGLVLGIFAAVFPWICIWTLSLLPAGVYIALVAGVVGIVVSVMARKQAVTSISTAGLVVSIIGTVLAAIGTACIVACNSAASGAAGAINSLF